MMTAEDLELYRTDPAKYYAREWAKAKPGTIDIVVAHELLMRALDPNYEAASKRARELKDEAKKEFEAATQTASA